MTLFSDLRAPYGTITADPPWRYNRSGVQGAVDRQFSTMTAHDIAALPVEQLAADNAHLYLWTTNPLMFGHHANGPGPTAADIVEAWGFRYITLLTWLKTGPLGIGHYFRGETEHAAFGIRGKAPIPPAAREKNIVIAAKGRHSAKPAAFYDMVERVSPAPRLELFARQPRLGWDHWGHGYETTHTPTGKATP